MGYSGRRFLQAIGLAVTATELAGCNGRSSDETTTAAETDLETETTIETTIEDTESSVSIDTAVAVVVEWNAMHIRLYDTVALAVAGRLGVVARATGDVFTRFEQSLSGWDAHERLEATSEQDYETSEPHLGGVREAYTIGGAECGSGLAVQTADSLLAAQRGRIDAVAVDVLEVLLFSARTRDAGPLAVVDEVDAAAELMSAVYEDFEDTPAHSSLESALGELYETFETAVEGAASVGDAKAIAASARIVANTMAGASYELASKAVASANHFAPMQAVGFDAKMFAGFGGPGDEFVRAAALSFYRARATDVPRLVAVGETDFAATVTSDMFIHFEGTRTHEALEGADHDTYEGFKGGLELLIEAAESDDGAAAEEAAATMDENLLVRISAPVDGKATTVFEATSFHVRLGDVRKLVAVGETDRTATVGEPLFARFGENEMDLHKSVEKESEEPYHRFGEEHLVGLVKDATANNADAATTHAEGVMDTLFEFKAAIGTTTEASTAEAVFFGARGFGAATFAQVGASTHAGSVVQSTFIFSESGAGGCHETLEEANHDLYESFEGALGSVRTAAGENGDVYGAAKAYDQKAVDSTYAVVATTAADAGLGAAVSERVTGAFQTFEEARVYRTLEEADRNAYESFEAALSDYIDTLADGSEVNAAVEAYVMTIVRARLAVAGEVDKAPEAGSSEDGGSTDATLSGGPDVVEGVPEGANHVVEMSAVAFEPAELTVLAGDTVAFEHVGDEAHSVTAYGDEPPEGAAYRASGSFESREAAETGWSGGKGVVQSGQPYVHTFEMAGEYAYYYVPHEAAGMTGTIVVEK